MGGVLPHQFHVIGRHLSYSCTPKGKRGQRLFGSNRTPKLDVDVGYCGEGFARWIRGLRPNWKCTWSSEATTPRASRFCPPPLDGRTDFRLTHAPVPPGPRLRN